MIRIKLGEEDRQRLGAPEVLEIDPTKPRLAHVRALQRETGFTVEKLSQALQGRELEALAALVWLALLRNDVKVPYAELDFDFSELELDVDEEPGKASGSTPS